jgi:hypothetical protein
MCEESEPMILFSGSAVEEQKCTSLKSTSLARRRSLHFFTSRQNTPKGNHGFLFSSGSFSKNGADTATRSNGRANPLP